MLIFFGGQGKQIEGRILELEQLGVGDSEQADEDEEDGKPHIAPYYPDTADIRGRQSENCFCEQHSRTSQGKKSL